MAGLGVDGVTIGVLGESIAARPGRAEARRTAVQAAGTANHSAPVTAGLARRWVEPDGRSPGGRG